MLNLSQMKIGRRLGLGFSVLALMLIGTACYGISRVNAVDAHTEIILHDRYKKISLAHELENEVNRQSRALRTALIADDPKVIQAEVEKVETSSARVSAALSKLTSIITSPEGKSALASLSSSRKDFLTHESELLALITGGKVLEGRQYLLTQMMGPQGAYLQSIEAFKQTQIDSMEKFGLEAEEMTERTQMEMGVVTGVALILSIAISFFLSKSITRPISEAVRISQRVAEGDLTTEIDVSGRDEAAQLLISLQRMQASLASVVSTVRNGSESVALASSEIAAGNSDLSTRTERDCSTLEETAAAMEQLGVAIQHNASNAQQANQLAQAASKVAVDGGQVVGQVVETMKGIDSSSQKISEIISVIDGIAFQTNILALNAAVEAARAGDQGRGFAVVAAEVRNLAGRSAEAAGQIKELIGDSVARVAQGSSLVNHAGVKMNEVVAAINKVTEVMKAISVGSAEQSEGIHQVGNAIVLLDRATQQNSALVEEMAAAADGLRIQSKDLVHAVSVFRVGSEFHGALMGRTADIVNDSPAHLKRVMRQASALGPDLQAVVFTG